MTASLPRRIALVGASGSIGQQTVQICDAFPDRLQIELLSVHSNVQWLIDTCRAIKPSAACITGDVQPDEVALPDGVATWY